MFNFSEEPVTVYPIIDETLLGFSVRKIETAFIPKLQRKRKIHLKKGIALGGKNGMILIVGSSI